MFDFTLAVIRIDVNDLAVLPWEKIVFSCLSNFSNEVTSVSGGFKVGGARGKTKKGGPSDDVIILSQPW